MRVAIPSDQRAFQLKSHIARGLERPGCDFCDFEPRELDDVDQADYAVMVARTVASGERERGIMVCGTGQGMSISANKVTGIRAAVCHDTFSARMSRKRNDANVPCLGERVVVSGLAAATSRRCLQAEFSHEERHRRRVSKINALDKG